MGQSRKKDDNALLWGIAGLGGAWLLTGGFKRWPVDFEGVSNILPFDMPDLTWPWEGEGFQWPWEALAEGVGEGTQGLLDTLTGGLGGLGEGAFAFGEAAPGTLTKAGLVGGRVVAGKTILKSQAARRMATRAGETTARILARAGEAQALKGGTAIRRATVATGTYLKVERVIAPKTGALALTTTAGKGAARVAVKTGVKVVPRLASRAVPILGWGLLAVDIVADIARLGGADVTEWLGISPIFAGRGQNPLERLMGEPGERLPFAP